MRVPSMSLSLGRMPRFALGGLVHPSMGTLAIQDALMSQPQNVMPDYMQSRMKKGGLAQCACGDGYADGGQAKLSGGVLGLPGDILNIALDGGLSPGWNREAFEDTMRDIPSNAPRQIGNYMIKDLPFDMLATVAPGAVGAGLMRFPGAIGRVGARMTQQLGPLSWAPRKSKNIAHLSEELSGMHGIAPDRYTVPALGAAFAAFDPIDSAKDYLKSRINWHTRY